MDLMLPSRDLDFDLDLSAAICVPTSARSNLGADLFRELFLLASLVIDFLSLVCEC